MIFGEVASQGLARGTAVVYDYVDAPPITCRVIAESEVAQEIARFDAAVAATERDMIAVGRQAEQKHGKDSAAIWAAQLAFLRDPLLRETVHTLCTTKKQNVEAALSEAIATLTATFARLASPYFRERAADLRDVGNRLQQALAQRECPPLPVCADGSVLIARELLPSVILQLDEKAICGVVVEQGGQTAHATILARARGIPLLINVPNATKLIRSGDPIIVDGLAGRIFLHASEPIQREYDRLEADRQAHKSTLNDLIPLPAVTTDQVAVTLCANIGKVADAMSAASVNADGAGLYRTEFVFLAQDHFPLEDEQYKMYRAAAESLHPREVVIRVLDIGSDKLLSYFPLAWEANPSLGHRGIRLLLAHPEILHVQLRAILRLSATHPVSILLPMVGGMEDLRAATEVIERAKAELATAGLPFNPNIQVGVMIETPAAVILAGRLAREADFLSVGTNDLVQYLLTTDRTSPEVAAYYEPLHPAVLAALASVVAAARKNGKRVSICGEMAGNPACTGLLLGLGFRNLSVNPSELLEIKNAIRSISLEQANHLAQHLMGLDTVQAVKEALRAANAGTAGAGDRERGPKSEVGGPRSEVEGTGDRRQGAGRGAEVRGRRSEV